MASYQKLKISAPDGKNEKNKVLGDIWGYYWMVFEGYLSVFGGAFGMVIRVYLRGNIPYKNQYENI